MEEQNISQFNALTGYLMADLYGSFPQYKNIKCSSYAINFIEKDDYHGSFEWGDFVKSTLLWLSRAEYIWLESVESTEDILSVTLSPKGLELLKIVPDTLEEKETNGSRLRKFVADQAMPTIQEFISQAITFGFTNLTMGS